MYKKSILILSLLLFSACDNEKQTQNYDGKKLLEQKCATCHDTHMPPVISKDELAPPMMAVSFHIHNFMKPSDESQRTAKAVEFVVDYVLEPSLEKSFCDKESLKRYGLMPSQKGNVTKDETKAIAKYMFNHFTQKNLSKKQEALAKFNALAQGQRIAIKYKCMGCHKIDKKIVGPSFKDISKKYTTSKDGMIESIKNGSKEKWESSNGAVMPPFKKIGDEDLEILLEWITKL